MAGESIPSLLNQVWAAFRRAGITDDLRIIEAVAGFLLEQEGASFSEDFPRKAKASDLEESTIRENLLQASNLADGAGNLFDRHVLFRLDEMRTGGQYITPRHVVRLMIALAKTKGQPVADFACGSAGFLVRSGGNTLTGVEISPEWARIARANLSLNGLTGEVREGNALRMVKPDETFDRIVMNPPFGAKIKSDVGARSETALINLAMDHLSTNGRAALLAPGGLLFSGSQAETSLRERLIDKFTLEAVITLPADAFQPYSTLTTHLLLIENTPPNENTVTWFLRPVYDGYVSGRGRDLTEPEAELNDLTLIEKAVAEFRQKLSVDGETPFAIQPLPGQNNELLGLLVRPTPEATLQTVRYLPAQADQPALLLLEIQNETRHTFWQVALTTQGTSKVEETPEKLIRDRLGLKPKDELPAVDIFQVQSIRWGKSESQHTGGILVKAFGQEKPQLMGVAIPRMTLQMRGYTLQPDDYLRAPEVSAAFMRPHDILRNIYERQRKLGQNLEKLAGWLAPESPKTIQIPAPVDVQPPFGSLSENQEKIWQSIDGMRENNSAKPFTSQDVSVECGEDEKRLALAIFEAMGLIVPITLKNPETDQPMNFYRLAEENDHWAGAEGEPA